MSTMTCEAPAVKASRLAVGLVLTINATEYGVEPIDPGEDGSKAFRLVKRAYDDAVYDVVRGRDGLIRCDCADYTMRREGLTCEPCKHGKALRQMGLLDAPKATPTPAPRRPHPCPHCGHSTPADTSICPRCGRDEFDEPGSAPRPSPKAPEAPSRPFAAGVPSGGPSEADRAAVKAFGIKLPAKAETPCCEPSEPAPCARCVPVEPAPAAAFDCGCPEALSGPPAEPRGDDRGDDGRRLDLAEWIDRSAGGYGLLNTMAGDLVARHLCNLAAMVRAVQSFPGECLTPMEAEARLECLSGA